MRPTHISAYRIKGASLVRASSLFTAMQRADGTEPSRDVEERLRFTYQVVRTLSQHDSPTMAVDAGCQDRTLAPIRNMNVRHML
jgi:hypothetical protein